MKEEQGERPKTSNAFYPSNNNFIEERQKLKSKKEIEKNRGSRPLSGDG